MPRSSTAKLDDWDDFSDWYDREQGESGDLWHWTPIDPGLLRVVRGCRGKDALDLGSGNGYLSRRLTTPGTRVTAVDESSMLIRSAQARDKGAGVPEAPLHLVIETSESE
ncbi:MAG: methyltransferase [Nitrososphaerota archaeon]|nr:methyltransferase [Nitrososphaerota archaeon]MDG6955401.1 methyltransferase [Nitrososphaerota archaeon]MDG6975455.1 methyltransferase [Nitrososphaerota archaeon]